MPPPAPVPPRHPRSFAGPVVLIVLGIFFLLGNMGIIAWHDLGRSFSRFWPALLILWGIIKLIEYQNANRAGVRARGIGAGGILLIIFLVVTGLISTEAYRLDWNSIRDQMHIEGQDMPWWGHTYSYEDALQQGFPAGANLQVLSERGAVNVTTSDDQQVHVAVHKRINADRQDDADKWDKSTRPQITRSGSVLTINANTQGAGDHWVSNDLDISVPRKASVAISTRHGDISVIGRDGSAELTSQHGEVVITEITGSAVLNLDHSSARVSQVSGDVTVQGRANDVSLEDIKGAVRLNGDFMEAVRLSRIAKTVSFKSTRTDMEFAKLDGDLNLDSGDLEASNVNGPLRLRTRSKDIVINGIAGDIHLQNENGAVEIHVNKLGNLDVSNSRGDIRIFLPEKSPFQLDAHARDGEIQTDFSELKIDNQNNRAAGSGSVGNGGPHMILNDEHGTIEIRRGVAIPTPPPSPPLPNIKLPKVPKVPTVPDTSEN
jgi:DUF4097 and DUF4098 domain-containing protein YvlB